VYLTDRVCTASQYSLSAESFPRLVFGYYEDYAIADDFHTCAIEWDEDRITWFYDGVE
jgi:beta-glucanase (GH16 family)